jgi:CRISPR-associated protein Cmr6
MSRLHYPKETRTVVGLVPPNERHPLLQLDRFTVPVSQKEQKSELEKVVAGFHDSEFLKDLAKRRMECMRVSSNAFACWIQSTSSPLALHLSHPGVLENAGTCLHSLYGFAYIPATGLKGMARSAAVELDLPSGDVLKIFGSEPGELRQSGGVICFHDSWSVTWPRLVLDIATPHHQEYYQKGKNPGDWEDPVPLYFLTVPENTTFEFLLSLRHRDGDPNLLDKAKDCLAYALERLGAGGKTNAGYGRFSTGNMQPATTERQGAERQGRKTHQFDLFLVTRGYLGGADWSKDATLRVSAIRGQLRWWWRAMHAGFLSVDELRKLESAIWGSTSQSSAVAMSLKCIENPKLGSTSFDQQTQSGLVYLSYGMNPDNKRPEARKWLEGGKWELGMRFRRTTFVKTKDSKISLTDEDVKKQILAALWMLGQYGGVGAKCRKGFGSLSIEGSFDALGDTVMDSGAFETSIQGHNKEIRNKIGAAAEFSSAMVQSPAIFHPRTIRGEKHAPVGNNLANQVVMAFNRLGEHYKAFATSLKHQPKKAGLGLPRKIDGPKEDPNPRQESRMRETGEQHKPPQYLLKDGATTVNSTEGGKIRYASPLHFHVAKKEGSIIVRWIGIPAVSLPTLDAHANFLDEVNRHLALLSVGTNNANAVGQPGDHRPQPQVLQPTRRFIKVKVKLLEKTDSSGKVRFKVKELGSEIQGTLIDGVPPKTLPELDAEIEVYKDTSANPPRYRWDEPQEETKVDPKNNRGNNNRPRR